MSEIELKEIASLREFAAMSALRVQPAQRRFSRHWMISFLQTRHPAVTSYSVLRDGQQVGFVMLIHAQNPTQWIIERLTIDRENQRQGLGYAVADRLIDMVHGFENSEMVIARYHPDNEAARALFTKLGFDEREELFRGRHVAVLEFEFEEDEADDELDEADDELYDDDELFDDDELDEDDADTEDDWEDESSRAATDKGA